MSRRRLLWVTFLGVLLACTRPADAADALKVFCVARPPAADADEKMKKDQAEAPLAVADITKWLKGRDKGLVLVDTREAADIVLEVAWRHLPKFGRRSIAFTVTVGDTPLGGRTASAGNTWTALAGSLVDALEEWARKGKAPIAAAIASRPKPAAEADVALLHRGLDAVVGANRW